MFWKDKFKNMTGYINLHKSNAFLYTNSKQTEKKILDTSNHYYTIVSKNSSTTPTIITTITTTNNNKIAL